MKEKLAYALDWPGSKRGTGLRIFNTLVFIFLLCALLGVNVAFALHWVQQGLDGIGDIVVAALADALILRLVYVCSGRAKAPWLRWKATEEGIRIQYPLCKERLVPWEEITRGYYREVRVVGEVKPVILLHKTYTLPSYFSTAKHLNSFCRKDWTVLAYTPQAEAALKGHIPLSNIPVKSFY